MSVQIDSSTVRRARRAAASDEIVIWLTSVDVDDTPLDGDARGGDAFPLPIRVRPGRLGGH